MITSVIVSNLLLLIVTIRYNQHHHLSVAAVHVREFLTNICTFSSPSLPFPQPSEAYFQYICCCFFWFFIKKTAYNLFSEADCSKLSPVINKQRGIGKARGKEKDRSSVALIGTTSHTEVLYHSHQQQPCFTSCLPVPCYFPLLCSV